MSMIPGTSPQGRYKIKLVVCIGMIGDGGYHRPDYAEMTYGRLDNLSTALDWPNVLWVLSTCGKLPRATSTQQPRSQR